MARRFCLIAATTKAEITKNEATCNRIVTAVIVQEHRFQIEVNVNSILPLKLKRTA